MENNKMQQSKETIRNWLISAGYPREFLLFFFQWTLLNLYYNELSQESKEFNRVLEFGRKYEKMFYIVRNETIDLIKTECVGEGKGPVPPNSYVKAASFHLRKTLNIDLNSVCDDCRREKREKCEGIKTEQYNFGKMEALMRVLYQIRCNLFHGDKTEYENGEHAERNKFLVNKSNQILKKVLNSIA